jgi:hypothetical protein
MIIRWRRAIAKPIRQADDLPGGAPAAPLAA